MAGFLPNLAFYVLPFLLVIGVVVTIHEFGHFLAAKALGTKIDQFSIGFGKAVAHWTDKSGVEWRLGWLPIGGFVRFAGDENAASVPDQNDLAAMRRDLVAREGEASLQQYYHFKPVWQRAIISAAGPVANFILAITIFAGLLFSLGDPTTPVRVDSIAPGSAAQSAGFQLGDVVLSADGRQLNSFEDLRMTTILRSGTPINFLVERGPRQVLVTATPHRAVIVDDYGHKHSLGQLGIGYRQRPGDLKIRPYSLGEAVIGGTQRSWDRVSTTLQYIGRMATGRETAEQLAGPLGMAQFSGDVTKKIASISPTAGSFAANAAITMLEIAANISVGIGFLNLLPIPVLDGGHLLFYAYEAVARRPLAAKVQAAGYRVGLALVLGLMLFATWNDLQRLRVFNFIGGLFS
jgi:regulator of sigma E protease